LLLDVRSATRHSARCAGDTPRIGHNSSPSVDSRAARHSGRTPGCGYARNWLRIEIGGQSPRSQRPRRRSAPAHRHCRAKQARAPSCAPSSPAGSHCRRHSHTQGRSGHRQSAARREGYRAPSMPACWSTSAPSCSPPSPGRRCSTARHVLGRRAEVDLEDALIFGVQLSEAIDHAAGVGSTSIDEHGVGHVLTHGFVDARGNLH
jgi:hypothetical protein